MEEQTWTELASEAFDLMYDAWEKRTSETAEKVLRNPTLLHTAGVFLSIGHRNRVNVSRTLGNMWRGLNLASKDDQDRTLHLINELNSRIMELEENLATAKPTRATATRTQPARAAATAVPLASDDASMIAKRFPHVVLADHA